jgi:hypothetical protein
LLNASYEAQGAFDPVVASPYNEYATDNIEPDLVDPLAIYPAVPVTIQEYNDTCNLVTQLGQYDALSEDLFLLQEVQLELYYSLSDDHLPPKTTVIDSITPLGSGVVEIKVGAVDESGIERVVVSYIDDINQTIRQLRSIDLNYDDASLKWIGSFTGDADSRFLVQIVDTAGNITTATNKGRYFQPGEVTASACSGKCVMLPIIIR